MTALADKKSWYYSVSVMPVYTESNNNNFLTTVPLLVEKNARLLYYLKVVKFLHFNHLAFRVFQFHDTLP